MLMTSCEGFKVLSLYNASRTEAIITTRPSLSKVNGYRISDFPNSSASDSSKITLKADSVLLLSSIFTGLLFNNNLKERDLRITYLKIETPQRTIEAKNKTEIINLLSDTTTRYNNAKLISSRNFRKIVIRQ
jgi:hypothetical protein